jgi:AcrR family transcriptional regulator
LPRTPDPELEHEVTRAALRLLDTGGLPAVTLRAVAGEAGTTTPTIYERFRDRDELLQSVRQEVERELLAAIGRAQSVSEFIKRCLDYNIRHPYRVQFIAETLGFRLAAGEPTPVYDRLKELLTQDVGVRGNKREQLGMAIASLVMGTARMIVSSGIGTPAAKDFYRTCQSALQLLLKAFSATNTNA